MASTGYNRPYSRTGRHVGFAEELLPGPGLGLGQLTTSTRRSSSIQSSSAFYSPANPTSTSTSYPFDSLYATRRSAQTPVSSSSTTFPGGVRKPDSPPSPMDRVSRGSYGSGSSPSGPVYVGSATIASSGSNQGRGLAFSSGAYTSGPGAASSYYTSGHSNSPGSTRSSYGPIGTEPAGAYIVNANQAKQHWDNAMAGGMPPPISPDKYSTSRSSGDGLRSLDSSPDLPLSHSPIRRCSTTSGTKSSSNGGATAKPPPPRRPSNRDEFSGPHQLLAPPSPSPLCTDDTQIPALPTHLHPTEIDQILTRIHDRLALAAYTFVATYQFPIPLLPSQRPVTRPEDREWTEWVYLLKRLATKRRIPARVLHGGRIKEFVTVLENSVEVRHGVVHRGRGGKDDWNVLQLVSAGVQVCRLLRDGDGVRELAIIYDSVERLVRDRRAKGEGQRGAF